MNKLKKLLSAVLVSSMILGMAACEDAPAPAGGNDGGDAAITTTQPTGTGAGTTTDPDANAATDEEIKSAYNSLVRKYHPDNYTDDNPLKDLAKEKMQEINAAYDEIQKLRSKKSKGNGGYYIPSRTAQS